jgi:hypothetical protein
MIVSYYNSIRASKIKNVELPKLLNSIKLIHWGASIQLIRNCLLNNQKIINQACERP